MAYPLSSMGAHVAAVPNHQTGRITPIETRAAVAFFGVFGYELDPTAPDAGGTGGGRGPDRVLQGRTASCSSAAGSSACEARSRTAATGRPGWSSRPTRRAPSSGYYRVLNRPGAAGRPPAPARAGPGARLPGHAAGRGSTIRSSATTPAPRGGDELMSIGLSLGADRHDADGWGDFRAWLFLLERPRRRRAVIRAQSDRVRCTHCRAAAGDRSALRGRRASGPG